jgi:hypothetical protein
LAGCKNASVTSTDAPKWLHETEPEIVRLLRLAAGQTARHLAAARHSDKWAAFAELETGPVNGLSF